MPASGWGTPLPPARHRAIGLEERGAEGHGMATISAMVHDRATSIQSAIADAIFRITGKRVRDLPFRWHDLTWGA